MLVVILGSRWLLHFNIKIDSRQRRLFWPIEHPLSPSTINHTSRFNWHVAYQTITWIYSTHLLRLETPGKPKNCQTIKTNSHTVITSYKTLQFDPPSILYDPVSPSSYDPYQSPNITPNRPPSPFSANLRCLDIHDPGPSDRLAQKHLHYEDSPSPYERLKDVISTGKEAADLRSTEAETLFGTVANLLDLYCASNTHMPARKAYALKLFCDELSEVTSKNFGVYIRDIPATSLPKKSLCVNLSPNDACLGIRSPKSYANAIKSRNPNTHFNTKSDHLNSTRHNSSKEHADDRLFLRLSNDNSLRAYSGFALLDYIKSELGSDKDLIKDVLLTKTGFSLCPFKGNLKALDEKIL